jgi:hypothetical protein
MLQQLETVSGRLSTRELSTEWFVQVNFLKTAAEVQSEWPTISK